MIRKLTADYVCTGKGESIPEGVVVIDGEEGRIEHIGRRSEYEPSELEHYRGMIIPGLVNAHCHLELSHMKGLVDTGTGLIPFITKVVTSREADPGQKKEAMIRADRYMEEQGIVAVGDISNVEDSFEVKRESKLRYHTFVEAFDLLQEERAEETLVQAKKVYDKAPDENGHRKSLVPHAPYSVSVPLFEQITQLARKERGVISMHNAETLAENELFQKGSGAFHAFFEQFELSLDHFEAPGKTSLLSVHSHLSDELPTLLVHNTLTTEEEMRFIQETKDRVYWATCPNANLYIENMLPDYESWIRAGANICIGTDSLTSNWQLSVLEEMRTLAKFNSYLSFDQLLQWASLNGAMALGFDDDLGSLEPGKTPGLKLLALERPTTEALLAPSEVGIKTIV